MTGRTFSSAPSRPVHSAPNSGQPARTSCCGLQRRVHACSLALCLSLAPSARGQPSRTGPFPPAAQASLHSQLKGMSPPEPRRSRGRQRYLLSCEMSLSVLDWGCHGAVLRAATGGITWAIAPGHLHPPFHKESHCPCCLTPPCPNLVGFGGGGGVEGAVGGHQWHQSGRVLSMLCPSGAHRERFGWEGRCLVNSLAGQ